MADKLCAAVATIESSATPGSGDEACAEHLHGVSRLVEKFVKSLAAGRLDEDLFDFLFHPSIVWRTRNADVAEHGVKEGLSAAKGYASGLARAISEKGFSLRVHAVEQVGHDVIVSTRWTAPNGAEQSRCQNYVKIADGKVVSVTESVG
jgi:hypothetical protein